ncbi:MAG: hypothetical protein N4A74_12470 [Carboxylicivirga sp.]|jgi:hypothetical protein|nr:hypothetical protein [Carboxylicivirga sp.]
MKPFKVGQITKFHTPLLDEDPNQIYVVVEIVEEIDRPRAEIKALNTGLSFPPINTVNLDDLEIVEVDTADLMGHFVTIVKNDNSKVSGTVIEVEKQKIMLDLTKGIDGVKTNVFLTIQDKSKQVHEGILFVTG